MSLSELMIDIPAEHEANAFGGFDACVKKLGRRGTFHHIDCKRRKYEDCRRKYGCGKTHRVLTQLLNYHGVEILLRNRMWIMQFHCF